MLVRLLCDRAGVDVFLEEGEVVDLPLYEAVRLVHAGQAETYTPPAPSTATAARGENAALRTGPPAETTHKKPTGRTGRRRRK